ncbi:DNA polymerase III subunit epsilon [Candidatus Purcelliella pentastirinorum]|uniref:DNA polymerase III subunit epsilon n=1 Tax=Candidatus Purcelliella pentastirinorum TaxID=472834 RepID=A0AAX3N939_9ENTR|nr:DNA polymerase III subunit epsilon [Candidatus Purcelliella pentastirinorum]WDI78370.1 DNA polymerase III subunit epsilon [Candidatus Purcelliella pentastirinorum]WDR80603.1 DNA polymerase III subunit epsilon [Candidatus Purcelliella pentastirinorum]
MRKIILDTETTGINQIGKHYSGHKIIEIGAVEMINRTLTNNNFHVYLNPNRSISEESFNIHGISNEFLKYKPTFKEILDKFIKYIYGSKIIIHNAKFDIEFINYELFLLKRKDKISDYCKIVDSLIIARKIFPGKNNSLNSLCNYYGINIKKRKKHGALKDAKILANVYLYLTSNQKKLFKNEKTKKKIIFNKNTKNKKKKLKIIFASKKELELNKKYKNILNKNLLIK